MDACFHPLLLMQMVGILARWGEQFVVIIFQSNHLRGGSRDHTIKRVSQDFQQWKTGKI